MDDNIITDWFESMMPHIKYDNADLESEYSFECSQIEIFTLVTCRLTEDLYNLDDDDWYNHKAEIFSILYYNEDEKKHLNLPINSEETSGIKEIHALVIPTDIYILIDKDLNSESKNDLYRFPNERQISIKPEYDESDEESDNNTI